MDRKQAAKEILSGLLNLIGRKPASQVQKSGRGEIMALHRIAQCDGGTTPGELARQMGVSSARAAALLGALEAKGWIERQADPADRRRVQVMLTQAGEQHAQADTARVLAHVERGIAVLEDEEIQCCLRVLEKLQRLHSQEEERAEVV